MSPLRASFAALALAILLAGCGQPPSGGSGSTAATHSLTSGQANIGGVIVDGGTYSIVVTEFAGHQSPQFTQSDDFTLPEVRNGTSFTFTMKVEGGVAIQSDHVGGHYGPAMDPAADAPGGCTHVTGKVPGTFTITCQAMSQTGIYHFRAHVRASGEGSQANWWGQDLRFRII